MIIAGLQKVSLIDYPNTIAAVIFTQGCNFRCPYCHNPELVLPAQFKTTIPTKDVLFFLQKRINQLEGIVITGGEPTLQENLVDFIHQIKNFGYSIKLDTNGSRPGILSELFNKKMVDFVAMDIKAPFKKYPQVTGVPINIKNIEKSIQLIEKASITCQFRTTLARPLLCKKDVLQIQKLIPSHTLHLNTCRTKNVLNPNLISENQYSQKEIDILQKLIYSSSH